VKDFVAEVAVTEVAMEVAAMEVEVDSAEVTVLSEVQRAVAGVIGLIGGGLIITKPQSLL